jgi:hypothetical protein
VSQDQITALLIQSIELSTEILKALLKAEIFGAESDLVIRNMIKNNETLLEMTRWKR